MFHLFVLKKIERRSRCHKLSASTATGDGSNDESRTRYRKMVLFDTEAKNGGFLDLSGSKKTRECKAI